MNTASLDYYATTQQSCMYIITSWPHIFSLFPLSYKQHGFQKKKNILTIKNASISPHIFPETYLNPE
jgi:hypothetical protein